jgi:four helix bundle protein
MSDNPSVDKSHAFALRMVRLYKHLAEDKKEYMLSRKALDTGTSVGARVKSAQEAGSRAVFTGEMSVALQRASETEYWLELLHEGGYLETQEFTSIHDDCVGLIKLLTKIVKTSSQNP